MLKKTEQQWCWNEHHTALLTIDTGYHSLKNTYENVFNFFIYTNMFLLKNLSILFFILTAYIWCNFILGFIISRDTSVLPQNTSLVKIYTKPHPGLEWCIFQILSCEDIDDFTDQDQVCPLNCT